MNITLDLCVSVCKLWNQLTSYLVEGSHKNEVDRIISLYDFIFGGSFPLAEGKNYHSGNRGSKFWLMMRRLFSRV